MAEVSFGEWLKRRRGAEGWTQKQLAQQINCSLSAMRKMEAEERHPSAQVIERLAELFKVPQNERKSFLHFARGDWQALSSGESDEAPWHVSQHVTPRSNLPASITSFIGREKEQDEIIQLTTKNRLVTLAGEGGIGKTRLSLQVGQGLLNDHPHGVWFIALDSLSDPALVPPTVASVFDIREKADRPIIEILVNALRTKTTLLILDNCEHLLDACAQLITSLLQSCPGLKILVTSRETLNVAGEAVYYLPSLSIPVDEVSLETLIDYESVQLFAERATLAQSAFALTSGNVRTIGEICRRVDGIPLAIELAAARVNILNVEEILKQLDDSFALLASDGRTTLPRHQTLRTSMDWSWGLLSEAEQIFLRQLSVFAGGWTLESAQAVCDGDTLNLTNALVKKSLIAVDQEAGRETRYRFHEIVRQYARGKLIESGKEEDTRSRHLEYFLRFSERAEAGLMGPEQNEWYTRTHYERDNIRTALGWAAQNNEVGAGLYLSSRLRRFWEGFDIREGSRWLAEFIERPESRALHQARAKALLVQGRFLLFSRMQTERMRSAAEECLALYRACGDQYGEIDGLLLLAHYWAVLANDTQSAGLAQRALALSRSLGNLHREAYSLSRLGYSDPDLKRALTYFEQAISRFRQLKDWSGLANCLGAAANKVMLIGDLQVSEEYQKESVALYRQSKIKIGLNAALQTYGRIAFWRGDYEQARARLQESIEISENLGYRMDYLWSRAHLGNLILREGDLTEARVILSETARDFQYEHGTIGVVFTLEGMASFCVAVGNSHKAAALIGWADAERDRIHDTRPPIEQADVDRDIAACLAKMGEVAFSNAYDEGKKMSLDEAVAYALEEPRR